MDRRNHWIKLYVEINDDPKIGLLPVNARWRFISALALAGELDDGGFIPPVNDELAYRLHTEVETLQAEMRMLAGRGLAELRMHPDGEERWFLSHFAERQAPSTNAERQKQWRKRNDRNGDRNETLRKRYANVTPEAEAETETETETEYRKRGEGSGAIAPAPTPTPRPASIDTVQPIPEEMRAAKSKRGDVEPVAGMVSAAPPIIGVLARLSGYWPGDDIAPALVARFGDVLDEVALTRAVELWRLSGNKPTNWLGIADWYDELRRDPEWTPQARFKRGSNGASASPAKTVSNPAPGSQPVTW